MIKIGLGGRTRTDSLLLPKQAVYLIDITPRGDLSRSGSVRVFHAVILPEQMFLLKSVRFFEIKSDGYSRLVGLVVHDPMRNPSRENNYPTFGRLV